MVSCRVIFAQTLRSQKVAKVYWVNIQMSWLNIWIQIEYSNFQLSIFWGSILSTARCASISAFFVANTHKQVRFSAACWQLPLAWRKRSGRRETATSHFFFWVPERNSFSTWKWSVGSDLFSQKRSFPGKWYCICESMYPLVSMDGDPCFNVKTRTTNNWVSMFGIPKHPN